jgi:hypothetical protein
VSDSPASSAETVLTTCGHTDSARLRSRTVFASVAEAPTAHNVSSNVRQARLVLPRAQPYLSSAQGGVLDDTASLSAFDSMHSVDHGTLGASSLQLSSGQGEGWAPDQHRAPGRYVWHVAMCRSVCPNPDVVAQQV